MNRQDRQGARNVTDLERKYQFDRNFAEIMGVATDARLYAEEARKVAASVSETNNGLFLKVKSIDEDLNGENGVHAQLALKVETDANGNLQSKVHVEGDKLTIETDNFTLAEDGTIKAQNGEFTGKVTSDEVDITGGKFELVMSNGAKVKIGVDVDVLAVDSPDYDIENGEGSRVGIFSSFIQYISGSARASVTPIVFGWDESEGFKHNLVGTWYIGAIGSSTPVTSDETKKNSIESQPELYSRIFDKLRPVVFRYNNGTSNRLHTGLIAQEVEEAVLSEGVTTQDFAAICYDLDENGNKTNYGVRYEEIVSMCVKEIQLLKAKIKELEESKNNGKET